MVAGADIRLAAECYGDMDSYAMYTCLRTSLRISLRIHHNEESTQCVTGSDFGDGWRRYGSPISQAASDLSYLSKPDTVRFSQADAECSHRCVPVTYPAKTLPQR
ncbi:hypothetical protein DNI05_21140 [Salmonella enterica subsp. enterica serovar Newport]|nr:hypothetical protein [Salmonella enterica subsp. enterica serovar Newport]